jgi:TatD DNase family protein
MNLVDVHCHLNSTVFNDKINEVIDRAKKSGVKTIIVSGTNPEANKQVLEMSKMDPIIKISFGLHPIDALGLSEGETGIPKSEGKVDLKKEFKFIEDNKNKIVAIGEVGLDYHWDKEHHKEQKEILKKIIKLAIKIKKPLIMHTWEAEEDCLNILEEEVKDKIPVVLHCFAGKKSLVTRAKELGYYFSIPPSTVRTGNFNSLIKKIPIEQLLTETDAPWQSLIKGEINEPANVLETVKKIAEIKDISVEETADKIWENYKKVFSLI